MNTQYESQPHTTSCLGGETETEQSYKHTDVTTALSMPVPADFCKAVACTEHVIR